MNEISVLSAIVAILVVGVISLLTLNVVSTRKLMSHRIASAKLETEVRSLTRQLQENASRVARYWGIENVERQQEKMLEELKLMKGEVEGLAQRKAEIELIIDEKQRQLGLVEGVASIKGELEKLALRKVEIGTIIGQLQRELDLLNEAHDLQSFGFYQAKYDFNTPEEYQEHLEGVRFAQKQMLSGKIAAQTQGSWTVNGSAAEGRKQINQVLKLMLRAFNGESDAAIAKVRYNNARVMEERIRKSYEAVNKLGTVQMCSISHDYLTYKLQELFLVHEYREKQQAVKDQQREIRAQMREEEIARREIAKALENATRDEDRYSTALAAARLEVEAAVGARHDKLLNHIGNLERKLAEALTLKERALSRAQLTRSGHVYVISNLGSFGDSIYKIGMTRRLDPMDRVLELGDASVPFRFDIHAIIYSDDAPALETKLHQRFHDRRLNRINFRKEFFNVTLGEIAAAVHEFHGEVQFTLLSEAEEYRKTLSFIESGKSLAPLAFTEDAIENLLDGLDYIEPSTEH